MEAREISGLPTGRFLDISCGEGFSLEYFSKVGWKILAKSHDLDIIVSGLPAISSFIFQYENNLKYKTLITQELLKKKLLSKNVKTVRR